MRIPCLLLIVLAAGGCSLERTQDKRFSGLVHHCLQTVRDGVLYQRICPTIDALGGKTAQGMECNTLTYVDQFGFAVSLKALQQPGSPLPERIREELSEFYWTPGEHVVLRGALPSGSRFTITRLFRYKDREYGLTWLAQAVLRDAPFAGVDFVLPWHGTPPAFTPPWLSADPMPEPDTDYVRTCDST